MIIKRLTNLFELDDILPMMQEFHSQYLLPYWPYPFSSYLAHVVSIFFLPTCAVWVGYEDDKPIGYLLAKIQYNFSILECVLMDVYSKVHSHDDFTKMWDTLIAWAKENNCTYLVGQTVRVEDYMAKYGYKKGMTTLFKEL